MKTTRTTLILLSLLLGTAGLTSACTQAPGADLIKQFEQANVLYHGKDMGGALKIYRKVLKQNSGFVSARIMMGKVYFYRRNFKRAAKVFQKAYDQDQRNINALFWLAKTQSLESRTQKAALKNLELLLQLDSSHLEAWMIKGMVLENLKDVKGAIAAYRYGINSGRKLALLHLQLALLYRDAGMDAKAGSEFETALSLAKSDKALRKQINLRRKAHSDQALNQ